MGSFPRWNREDIVFATTQRTVDRDFLTLPTEFFRNLAGASAARALRKYPVKIYWIMININHEHLGVAPMDDSQEALNDIAKFKQLFHRLLTFGINKMLEPEGPLSSSPSRDAACLDNESVEEPLGYAITNPVKDGLVDRVAHWTGFSSCEQLAKGENPAYTYID